MGALVAGTCGSQMVAEPWLQQDAEIARVVLTGSPRCSNVHDFRAASVQR